VAPGDKTLPIGGVCLAGIGGAGGLDITAGPIGEALKVRRQGRGWFAGSIAA
jgi:hypothetical protein